MQPWSELEEALSERGRVRVARSVSVRLYSGARWLGISMFPPIPRRLGCPHRLARPRTPPFHGGDRGSNPLGDTNSPTAEPREIASPGAFSFVPVPPAPSFPAL